MNVDLLQSVVLNVKPLSLIQMVFVFQKDSKFMKFQVLLLIIISESCTGLGARA